MARQHAAAFPASCLPLATCRMQQEVQQLKAWAKKMRARKLNKLAILAQLNEDEERERNV